MVFILSLRRSDCNTTLRTKNCCSTVSTEITHIKNILIIVDLTHLAARDYLPSI